MAKKKGFPKKTPIEAKRFLILNDIAKGASYTELLKKYSKKWDVSPTTVALYIQNAVDFMSSNEFKESIVAVNMQRLDSIISDSMLDNDRKNAIKAIDTQNKLAGGYEEKVKIDTDGEINLVFDL